MKRTEAPQRLVPSGGAVASPSPAKPAAANAENINSYSEAFSAGFYACASYFVNDPDSPQFGETATQAWGDYAESHLGVCGRPPFGWFCTRAPGHSGPCAAVEAGS